MPATVESPRLRAESVAAGQQSRLRVRTAPALEPPFDDEYERPPAGMEMLPLPGPLFANPPAAGRRPAAGRPTARPGAGRGREQAPAAAPRQGTAVARQSTLASRPNTLVSRQGAATSGQGAGRGSGSVAARRFVGLCVEVLNGFRPVAQLRALTPPQRFDLVTDQLVRRTVRVRMSQEGRHPVRIRRVQVCEPVPGAVEAAAVLAHGDRTWAMAVRMERCPTGWQCAVLQVV